MKNIKQDSKKFKPFLGWYENIDGGDCVSEDISKYSNYIHVVFQFDDTGGVISYKSSNEKYLNGFNEFECGKAYYIVLKPGVTELNIPNFVFSDSKNSYSIKMNKPFFKGKLYNDEKINGQYHSNEKMFTFKVVEGLKYETKKYMKDIHDAVYRLEKILNKPYDGYSHHINIKFLDLSISHNFPDEVLAASRPLKFNSDVWEFGKTFSTESEVLINTKNIEKMLANIQPSEKSQYYSTILHEIIHALALNDATINYFKNVPVVEYMDEEDGKQKYYFAGKNCTNNYRILFKNENLVGVPLEDVNCVKKTDINYQYQKISTHFEEGDNQRLINGIKHPALSNALMTAYSDSSVLISTPLTSVTLGFFEDCGFGVNYKANKH